MTVDYYFFFERNRSGICAKVEAPVGWIMQTPQLSISTASYGDANNVLFAAKTLQNSKQIHGKEYSSTRQGFSIEENL